MGKAVYKVRISKTKARDRVIKAWETKRKNGTTTPWNKGLKGGQVAWNKGLNKSSDLRVLRYSKSMARTVRKQFKKGRKQPVCSPETRAKLANGKIGEKNPMRIYPQLKEGSRRTMLTNILRSNKPPTDIEKILYRELDSHNIFYEKKCIVYGLTAPDAYLPYTGTVIYADGSYWHALPGRPETDEMQNKILKSAGYNVLRYTDKQIKSENFSALLARDLSRVSCKRTCDFYIT